MSSSYRDAVASGYACPLPAPFMHVGKDHKCCIASSDGNVWPNFCANIGELGKATEGLEWELHEEVDLKPVKDQPEQRSGTHERRHLPTGIYRVGFPDVPKNYERTPTSIVIMMVYFVMFASCVSLYVYVFNWLAEETSILQGKRREEAFFSKRAFIDDDEDDDAVDSVSPSSSGASLSPAHTSIARTEHQNVADSMGQVSLSFGLLPALPRGRTSNLSSPRMSARGPPS